MWTGFRKNAAIDPGQGTKVAEFLIGKPMGNDFLIPQTNYGQRDFQTQLGGLQVLHHGILKIQFSN